VAGRFEYAVEGIGDFPVDLLHTTARTRRIRKACPRSWPGSAGRRRVSDLATRSSCGSSQIARRPRNGGAHSGGPWRRQRRRTKGSS